MPRKLHMSQVESDSDRTANKRQEALMAQKAKKERKHRLKGFISRCDKHLFLFSAVKESPQVDFVSK